jgi:nucleoside-diphosphate-sugar epimerase
MSIHAQIEKPFFPAETSRKLVAVVGADGFVGSVLAEAFHARRIVYGPCRPGDVHVTQAQALLHDADIIINAGGFRVRPGCTYADYQRSHQGATAALVPHIRRGACLLHISSASVLGKDRRNKLGNHVPPSPETFPSPAYATAKLEADYFVGRAAAERGFRVIFLRPAVVYALQGAGMIETMIGLAKKGIILRLYPRHARHHLCHTDLLVDVFRRVVERNEVLPHLSTFIVADPYTVTNQELETLFRGVVSRRVTTLPIPAGLLSAALGRTFHSARPKLDLKTWGEIFGVMNLDSEYDPSETFKVLQLDPSVYSIDKTLAPLVRQALRPTPIAERPAA